MSEISIALPVYNGARYLAEAIDSVLAQEFRDFELVVSDNCSTDETPQILEEYARRDDRIRVSRSDRFLPQPDNVSRAVELCTGPWVKLLCHDDLMLPNCLRVLHEVVVEYGTSSRGLIGNGEEWLYANGYSQRKKSESNGKPRIYPAKSIVSKIIEGTSPVGLPSLTTAMIHKRAWNATRGFDPRYIHFDVFLWLQVIAAWDYLSVPEVLTRNRSHPEQVTVSARRSLRSVDDCRSFYREFVAVYGDTLRLSRRARLLARLKAPSAGASVIAIYLLKGQLGRAFKTALSLPPYWWPMLPMLIGKNYQHERRRVKVIENDVPISLIYPD